MLIDVVKGFEYCVVLYGLWQKFVNCKQINVFLIYADCLSVIHRKTIQIKNFVGKFYISLYSFRNYRRFFTSPKQSWKTGIKGFLHYYNFGKNCYIFLQFYCRMFISGLKKLREGWIRVRSADLVTLQNFQQSALPVAVLMFNSSFRHFKRNCLLMII